MPSSQAGPSGMATDWVLAVGGRSVLGCLVERWFLTSDLLLKLIMSPVIVRCETRSSGAKHGQQEARKKSRTTSLKIRRKQPTCRQHSNLAGFSRAMWRGGETIARDLSTYLLRWTI